MNAAIVDTDVVSMLFKGDTRALDYRSHITGRLLGISFMTLAELERWSLERTDAWIAASALYYQVPLITNNRADYSVVDGLVLLSA